MLRCAGRVLRLVGASVLCLTVSWPALADRSAGVTGGGQYFGPFGRVAVTVHANQDSFGNVSGHFQQVDLDTGWIVHGQVTCLSFVADNIVVIGGTLTNVKKVTAPSSEIIQPGAVFFLAVQDNGEGRGAPADEVTSYVADKADAPITCSTPGLYEFLVEPPFNVPLSSGNFQVTR